MGQETPKKYMMQLGRIVTSAFILPVLMLYESYVITFLWRWFITSTFGLKPLSIPQALGFTLVAAMIQSTRVENNTSATEVALTSVVKTSLIWAAGFFVYSYFM